MGLFRRRRDDDFKALAERERDAAGEVAWFEEDDDAPELHVETGVSSNLRRSRSGPSRR